MMRGKSIAWKRGEVTIKYGYCLALFNMEGYYE